MRLALAGNALGLRAGPAPDRARACLWAGSDRALAAGQRAGCPSVMRVRPDVRTQRGIGGFEEVVGEAA